MRLRQTLCFLVFGFCVVFGALPTRAAETRSGDWTLGKSEEPGKVEFSLIERHHDGSFLKVLGLRHAPRLPQRVQSRREIASNQLLDGIGLHHDPYFEEVLEILEVERPDLPPAAKMHVYVAFVLKPEERLSNRRSAYVHASCYVAFAKFVAG